MLKNQKSSKFQEVFINSKLILEYDKKIFKGCLISILVFILILTGIYFYSTSPNDIKIEVKSFSVKEYKSELVFPKGNLPSFILEANNEDILYQV